MKTMKNILRAGTFAALMCSGVLHAQHGKPPGAGMMAPHEGPASHGAMRPQAQIDSPPHEELSHPTIHTRTEPLLSLNGRWWDNQKNAQLFRLKTEQVQHMDAVIEANKDTLLTLYSNLQHEQQHFVDMPREDLRDETKVFAQIDRIAQARAELEKANFHTLIQIRAQLTPDQLFALDKLIADVSQP
jgi:Spy/CpxP family protein refolding chaperone